jgi:uncharacterized protein YyaL (SSP411 family)
MRYAVETNDKALLDHVNLTLKKMAFGGIYDQVAGGFARYSTDTMWKVPHFEKMLYDNAQLISLYSSAYKLTKNSLYKEITFETIKFLKDEMSDGKGGYYSAYDADSEGEEGKYYVWTEEEIKKINFPDCGKIDGIKIVTDYFNINKTGYWEKNNYILLRTATDKEIASRYNLELAELKTFIAKAKSLLNKERNKREKPALDKKIITSWNALQISALCNAYQAFEEKDFLNDAIEIAERILEDATSSNGILLHLNSQKGKMNSGYLEDYAFTISAFIDLYQVTFDEKWLQHAKKLTDDAIKLFYDSDDGFFWYTSSLQPALVARKKEISDNVIASSNSEMAKALFILGDLFYNKKYSDVATRMINSIEENIVKYPSSYSNWSLLLMNYIFEFNEVVIAGENAEDFRKQLSGNYLPQVVFAGSDKESNYLSLFQNRFQKGKTLIYVCRNRTCHLPTESPKQALESLIGNKSNTTDVNYSR